MNEAMLKTQCPKCGEWIEDFDGFGVLRHEKCGYCAHPSRDGGVCTICGDDQSRDGKETAIIVVGTVEDAKAVADALSNAGKESVIFDGSKVAGEIQSACVFEYRKVETPPFIPREKPRRQMYGSKKRKRNSI